MATYPVSPLGIDFIKRQEGFSPKAYRDGNQWSIGHGTRALSPDEQIDEATAQERLNQELAIHADRVEKALANKGWQLPQEAKDMLIDADFNKYIGVDAINKAKDPQDIVNYLYKDTNVKGEYMKGLETRSKERQSIYGNSFGGSAQPLAQPLAQVSNQITQREPVAEPKAKPSNPYQFDPKNIPSAEESIRQMETIGIPKAEAVPVDAQGNALPPKAEEWETVINDPRYDEMTEPEKKQLFMFWRDNYKKSFPEEFKDPERALQFDKFATQTLGDSVVKGFNKSNRPYDLGLEGKTRLEKLRIRKEGQKDIVGTLNEAMFAGDLSADEAKQYLDQHNAKITREKLEAIPRVAEVLKAYGQTNTDEEAIAEAKRLHDSTEPEDQEKFGKFAGAFNKYGEGVTGIGKLQKGFATFGASALGAAEGVARELGFTETAESLATKKQKVEDFIDTRPKSVDPTYLKGGWAGNLGAGAAYMADSTLEQLPNWFGYGIAARMGGPRARFGLGALQGFGDFYEGEGTLGTSLVAGAAFGATEALAGVVPAYGRLQVRLAMREKLAQLAKGGIKASAAGAGKEFFKTTGGEIAQEVGQTAIELAAQKANISKSILDWDEQDKQAIKDTIYETLIATAPHGVSNSVSRYYGDKKIGNMISKGAYDVAAIAGSLDTVLQGGAGKNADLSKEEMEFVNRANMEDQKAIQDAELLRKQTETEQAAAERKALEEAEAARPKTDAEVYNQKVSDMVAAIDSKIVKLKEQESKGENVAVELALAVNSKKKLSRLAGQPADKDLVNIISLSREAQKSFGKASEEVKERLNNLIVDLVGKGYAKTAGKEDMKVKVINPLEFALKSDALGSLKAKDENEYNRLRSALVTLADKSEMGTNFSKFTNKDFADFNAITAQMSPAKYSEAENTMYITASPMLADQSEIHIRALLRHEAVHGYEDYLKKNLGEAQWRNFIDNTFEAMTLPDLKDFDIWIASTKGVKGGRAGIFNIYEQVYSKGLSEQERKDAATVELLANYAEYTEQVEAAREKSIFGRIKAVSDTIASAFSMSIPQVQKDYKNAKEVQMDLARSPITTQTLDWVSKQWTNKEIKANKPTQELLKIIKTAKADRQLIEKTKAETLNEQALALAKQGDYASIEKKKSDLDERLRAGSLQGQREFNISEQEAALKQQEEYDKAYGRAGSIIAKNLAKERKDRLKAEKKKKPLSPQPETTQAVAQEVQSTVAVAEPKQKVEKQTPTGKLTPINKVDFNNELALTEQIDLINYELSKIKPPVTISSVQKRKELEASRKLANNLIDMISADEIAYQDDAPDMGLDEYVQTVRNPLRQQVVDRSYNKAGIRFALPTSYLQDSNSVVYDKYEEPNQIAKNFRATLSKALSIASGGRIAELGSDYNPLRPDMADNVDSRKAAELSSALDELFGRMVSGQNSGELYDRATQRVSRLAAIYDPATGLENAKSATDMLAQESARIRTELEGRTRSVKISDARPIGRGSDSVVFSAIVDGEPAAIKATKAFNDERLGSSGRIGIVAGVDNAGDVSLRRGFGGITELLSSVARHNTIPNTAKYSVIGIQDGNVLLSQELVTPDANAMQDWLTQNAANVSGVSVKDNRFETNLRAIDGQPIVTDEYGNSYATADLRPDNFGYNKEGTPVIIDGYFVPVIGSEKYPSDNESEIRYALPTSYLQNNKGVVYDKYEEPNYLAKQIRITLGTAFDSLGFKEGTGDLSSGNFNIMRPTLASDSSQIRWKAVQSVMPELDSYLASLVYGYGDSGSDVVRERVRSFIDRVLSAQYNPEVRKEKIAKALGIIEGEAGKIRKELSDRGADNARFSRDTQFGGGSESLVYLDSGSGNVFKLRKPNQGVLALDRPTYESGRLSLWSRRGGIGELFGEIARFNTLQLSVPYEIVGITQEGFPAIKQQYIKDDFSGFLNESQAKDKKITDYLKLNTFYAQNKAIDGEVSRNTVADKGKVHSINQDVLENQLVAKGRDGNYYAVVDVKPDNLAFTKEGVALLIDAKVTPLLKGEWDSKYEPNESVRFALPNHKDAINADQYEEAVVGEVGDTLQTFAQLAKLDPKNKLKYIQDAAEVGDVRFALPNIGSVEGEIKSHSDEIARAAQEEYDAWDQDGDGHSEELGTGGICDRISTRISGILSNAGFDIVDGGQDGDDHAFIFATKNGQSFSVDISPRVYESGGGYNWRKKDNVIFDGSHVDIYAANYEDIYGEPYNAGGNRYALPNIGSTTFNGVNSLVDKLPDFVKDALISDTAKIGGTLGKILGMLNFDRLAAMRVGDRQAQETLKTLMGIGNASKLMAKRVLPRNADGTFNVDSTEYKESAKNISLIIAGEAPLATVTQQDKDVAKAMREDLKNFGGQMVSAGIIDPRIFELEWSPKEGKGEGYIPYMFRRNLILQQAKEGDGSIKKARKFSMQGDRERESKLRNWHILGKSKGGQEQVIPFATEAEAIKAVKEMNAKKEGISWSVGRPVTIREIIDAKDQGFENVQVGEESFVNIEDFIIDPTEWFPRYVIQATRDINMGKFFAGTKAALEKEGKLISKEATPPEGYRKLDDAPAKSGSPVNRFGVLAGYYVPKEVHEFLNGVTETKNIDDGMAMMLDYAKNSIDFWAKMKTIWNLGTHAANLYSNIVLAPVLGIYSPTDIKYIKEAVQIAIANYRGETTPEMLDYIDAGALGSSNNLGETRMMLDNMLVGLQQAEKDIQEGKGFASTLFKWTNKAADTTVDWYKRAEKPVAGVYGATDDIFKVAAYLKQTDKKGLNKSHEHAKAYLSRYGLMYERVPRNKNARAFKYLVNRFYSFTHQMIGVSYNVMEDAMVGNPLKTREITVRQGDPLYAKIAQAYGDGIVSVSIDNLSGAQILNRNDDGSFTLTQREKDYGKAAYLIGMTALPAALHYLFTQDMSDEDKKTVDEVTDPTGLWTPIRTTAYIDPMVPDSIKRFLGTDKRLSVDMSRYIPTLDLLGGRMAGYIQGSSDDPISSVFRYMISGTPIVKSLYQIAANENAYTGQQIVAKGTPNSIATAQRLGNVGLEFAPSMLTNAYLVNKAYTDPMSGSTYQKREPVMQAIRSFAGIDIRSAEPNDYQNYAIWAEKRGIPRPIKGDYDPSYPELLKRQVWAGISNGNFEAAAEAELKLRKLLETPEGKKLPKEIVDQYTLTDKELMETAKRRTPLKFAQSNLLRGEYQRDVTRARGIQGEVLNESMKQWQSISRKNLPNYLRYRKQYARENQTQR